MNEQEIIAELSQKIIQQAEEKVRITQWTTEVLESIDDTLKTHFDQRNYEKI